MTPRVALETNLQPTEESKAANNLTRRCPLKFSGGTLGAIAERLMRGASAAGIAGSGGEVRITARLAFPVLFKPRDADASFALESRIRAGSRNTRSNSLVQPALLSKPVAMEIPLVATLMTISSAGLKAPREPVLQGGSVVRRSCETISAGGVRLHLKWPADPQLKALPAAI